MIVGSPSSGKNRAPGVNRDHCSLLPVLTSIKLHMFQGEYFTLVDLTTANVSRCTTLASSFFILSQD